MLEIWFCFREAPVDIAYGEGCAVTDRRDWVWAIIAFTVTIASCTERRFAECTEGESTCSGITLVECIDGVERRTPCTTACTPELGCTDCLMGDRKCEGQGAMVCNEHGEWSLEQTCVPLEGTTCSIGHCVDPCAVGAAREYLGCEYWPVVTPNPALGLQGDVHPYFDFASVISNPNSFPVLVHIEGPNDTRVDRQLEPGEVAAIALPWVDELLQISGYTSRIVHGGAYHMRATAPIAAYAFNPLQYGVPDCDPFTEPPCSYSNDATLLLPTSALATRYILVAPRTQTTLEVGSAEPSGSPAYVAIVGTAPDTTVTLTPSAHLLAGDTEARAPGEPLTISIGQGDVALVFVDMENAHWSDLSRCTRVTTGEACEASADFDLTGSVLEASAPVAVYTGAPCHNVPYNVAACDTLLEQLLPVGAWGPSAVGVPLNLSPAPGNLFRVTSGAQGNEIHFIPSSVHEPITLDEGESLDFIASDAFIVEGSERLLVAQYLMGQEYGGTGTNVGDPSFAFLAPREQYRQSYDVLSPSTFTQSYVLVVAPSTARVMLDGTEVTLQPIASSDMRQAWIPIEPGPHHLESSQRFGILLGGAAVYSSYLMAGGLDATPILL
jgi:hypothetical protein